MRLTHNQVYFFHIIIVAPFLAYLGWYGKNANENAFTTCKVLSVVIALYHTYLLLKANSSGNINNLPNISNIFKSSEYTNQSDTEEYSNVNNIEIFDDDDENKNN